MGRMYTVVMDAIGVTAAKDLLRLSAPSDAVVIIHEVSVSQDSDAGDSEAEQLVLQLQRSSTDGTGTSATPEPLHEGDAAFGGTAVTNLTADTTIDGAPLWREGVNVQAGFRYFPTPETRPVISPSDRFVVRLDAAPGDSLTMNLVCVFEELGG